MFQADIGICTGMSVNFLIAMFELTGLQFSEAAFAIIKSSNMSCSIINNFFISRSMTSLQRTFRTLER